MRERVRDGFIISGVVLAPGQYLTSPRRLDWLCNCMHEHAGWVLPFHNSIHLSSRGARKPYPYRLRAVRHSSYGFETAV